MLITEYGKNFSNVKRIGYFTIVLHKKKTQYGTYARNVTGN